MKPTSSWPGRFFARFGLPTLLLGLVFACSDDESNPVDPVPPLFPVLLGVEQDGSDQPAFWPPGQSR